MALIQELEDEFKEWDKAQLTVNGYPDFMAPDVAGLPIDMLQMFVSIIFMGDLLKEHLKISDEDFDVGFQKRFAQFLKNTRLKNIERIKQQRAMGPQIAVAQSKLLGPNGEPMQ